MKKTNLKKINTQNVEIIVKADHGQRHCHFFLSKPILKGYSWKFLREEEVHLTSPLAKSIFTIPEIVSLSIFDSQCTIETYKSQESWEILSNKVKSILRNHFYLKKSVLVPEDLKGIPTVKNIEGMVLEILKNSINPALEGHGGMCSLEKVVGNSVFIRLNGRCQGCQSSSDTVQIGIYQTLKEFIPKLGIVFDKTDHSKGINPFYPQVEKITILTSQ